MAVSVTGPTAKLGGRVMPSSWNYQRLSLFKAKLWIVKRFKNTIAKKEEKELEINI